MTSAIPVQCSTNWAIKPLGVGRLMICDCLCRIREPKPTLLHRDRVTLIQRNGRTFQYCRCWSRCCHLSSCLLVLKSVMLDAENLHLGWPAVDGIVLCFITHLQLLNVQEIKETNIQYIFSLTFTKYSILIGHLIEECLASKRGTNVQ